MKEIIIIKSYWITLLSKINWKRAFVTHNHLISLKVMLNRQIRFPLINPRSPGISLKDRFHSPGGCGTAPKFCVSLMKPRRWRCYTHRTSSVPARYVFEDGGGKWHRRLLGSGFSKRSPDSWNSLPFLDRYATIYFFNHRMLKFIYRSFLISLKDSKRTKFFYWFNQNIIS